MLAFVYDVVHAPHAAPRLRAAGTVYVPALAAAAGLGSRPAEQLQVTYCSPAAGGGSRSVDVDLELRVVVLTP